MNAAPTVTLLSHTESPIETLACVWDNSRSNDPVVPPWGRVEKEDLDLFQKIIDSKIPVAEMIDFVFLLENVSIAFREQMVRHRIGVKVDDRIGVDIVPDLSDSTWWSQSMRVLNMGQFFTYGQFEIPSTVKTPEAVKEYRRAMAEAQNAYNALVKAGVPEQDARMVLPMSCHHRVVWKLNLASLMHIVGKRACWILQLGFWGPIIHGMVDEIAARIHPSLRRILTPPCCKGNEYVGCHFLLDNEKRMKGEDPLPPCALALNNEHTLREHPDFEKWADAIGDVGIANDGTMLRAMALEYEQLWGRDIKTGALRV